MKKYVRSAELKYYNANSRGNNTSDCVKRSISLAFDIPYNEVTKLLNAKMRELHLTRWNVAPVFKPVILELGASKGKIEKSGLTVEEFADTHDLNNIYIVLCGKANNGSSSHMVCVRDGKVWDSWDSRGYYVTIYWTVDGANKATISELDEAYLEQLTREHALPIIETELRKYADKKGMQVSYIELHPFVNDYTIDIEGTVRLDPNELISKKRDYEFSIVLTIEPRMSDDEVIKFIETKSKQKAYDKMWTINEQEKKLKEAAEVAAQLDPNDTKGIKPDYWYTAQEKKFLKSLPGWAQPLVKSIRIQDPGKYIDSYTVRMRKFPGDTYHPDIKDITFTAETGSDMREMIEEYRETGRIEGIDYNWWDEH